MIYTYEVRIPPCTLYRTQTPRTSHVRPYTTLVLFHCLLFSTCAQGARSLFTGLFTVFTDGNDLETLVADVSEESKTVMFVWRIPVAGFQDGSDTFVFGKNNKILRQFAIVRTG